MVKGRANLNSLSLNYLFLVEISFRMVLPSPFFLSCSLFFFFFSSLHSDFFLPWVFDPTGRAECTQNALEARVI